MRHLKATKTVLTLLTVTYFFPSLFAQATMDGDKVMHKMYDAIKQVKTLKYNLYASERIEDKYSKANSQVKLNVAPFKAYYKDLKKGIEALYVEGQESNDAIVNPNGFQYFNLHLDPR